MTTRRYRITGMHCASCGLLIDDALEDLPGVASSSTAIRSGCTEVTVDPGAAVADDAVVAAITSLGYQALPLC